MNFGLGLVLSFTDNSTAGINNAVNSLSQLTQVAENASNSINEFASLSAFSSIATSVGNSMTSMGANIISTFGQIIGKVNQTGQTLMFAENQLNKLYEGSSRTGKDVLADITEYAKTSIFEFEDLIPSVIMLKANGIEAFDMIASSTGNARQTLMDYAADLAAFNPQMRNMYGTGINAAMGALNEYIAEGNARSLKTGASLDITGILGEEKGATIEERSRQVADLLEQLNMVGMTADLANTPMTKLSNMSDTLFQFIGMISNSGVYDAFNEIIDVFSEFVYALDDETLQTLADTIGEALSSLLTPVKQLAQWIVKLSTAFIELVKNNPSLAKFATIATSIAGSLLVVGGVALKFAGSLGYMSLMLKSLSTSFSSIGSIMKIGATKILSALIPVTLALGMMYFVWKNDIFSIRTLVTGFVQNVVNSFNTARTSISGSLSDLQKTLSTFDTQNNFFDRLTLTLMQVMVLFQSLSEGWNDYTLSEDTFNKAKELGILPLIKSIFDLKYRFEFFKKGFIDGWKEIGENVKKSIEGFLDNIEGTPLESLVDNLTEFLQKLASGDTQAWYDFGKSFADFTAGALVFYGVVKSIGAVARFLTPIVSVFQGVSKLGGVFGKIATGIGAVTTVFKGGQGVGFFTKLLEVFRAVASGGIGLKDSLTIVFGSVGTTVAGIISFVGGLALAITGFVKQITEGFSWVWEIIKWVGLAIAAVGAVILGIATGPVAAVVAAIVGAVTLIIELVVNYWDEICAFFSTVGSWIYDNVIKPVADFFVGLWNGIVTGVMTVVNAIKNFFSTIANWIYTNVIQPVVNFFTTIIFPIISKIVEIVMKIVEIIVVLVSVFVQWIKTNVIDPIVNFFVGLWNTIVAGITSFVESAKQVIGTIVEWINTNIITPIASFFSTLWNGIVTGVTTFINAVKSVFITIVNWIKTNIITPISNFFSTLWTGITNAFNVVKDTITEVLKGAVNSVLNFIGGLINGVIESLNNAIDIINNIPGVSITKIDLLEVPQLAQGGVVETPTLSVIGEAGKEAVMPLENNTGWIGNLATMISSQMENIRPTNTSQMTTTNNGGDTNQRYLTNNNNTNNTYEGDTYNSVVFNEGAIQIVVQNATEEEAIRMAKVIMEYIRRQKELDRMLQYA